MLLVSGPDGNIPAVGVYLWAGGLLGPEHVARSQGSLRPEPLRGGLTG